MAVSKAHLHGRSSNCLRKYRLFFVFGVTILCAQVYLAYTFFALENERLGVSRPSSGEQVGSSQVEEVNKGLPKGSRQLKLPPDKEPGDKILPYRNRTRVKLDTRSLNFTPICEITSREAISAVTRAQTQICKQRIVNATCLSQDGSLYPQRIQSSCPNSQGFVGTPKSLGCYKDDKTLRILSGYYAVFKSSNSPEKCAYMCLQSGYVYAGVEYSMECFCGMEEPPRVKRLPDSSCNMQCPGNPKNSCGGFLTINVYSTGIQRFKAQEARNSSLKNTKEPPIRIAYLLTVNGRASRQVKRLISTLYHPSHLFYIHVDARQDYLYREMLEVENSCATNNIKVARGEGLRHASIWGGASLLTTLLTSAHEMLQHPHYWDFLVNLSESDFPVKTNEYLTEFLGWNRGFNFVKSHGREVQRFITKQGLDKTFVECEARMWRVGDRKLPNGIQIDGGSDWVALSRDFVQYVAKKEPDTLVVNLLKIFQYTLLPAESFFHTVLRNSKFCQTYIDNNLHVTNWKRKLGCKCQYKAVVDWCGCSPNDFKLEDFNRIRKTNERNLFFARKFEPMIDQRIIDKVQEWLYPEKLHSMVNSNGYDMYWQSIYHHADLSPPVDDALLTISNSLARIGFQQKLALNSTRVRLLETTVYFKENKFHGVLVRAEVTKNSTTLHGEVKEQFEALVQVKPNFSVNKTWLSGKIKSLEVSTDYDQKEQTFRNLVRSIGPLSNPILGYEFDLDLMVSQNFTVLWVDPSGRLADVNQVQVDESSLIGFVKPQLPNRLSIGKWMVLLVSNSMVISNLSFLVIPLSYWENKRISLEKSKEINEKQSPALYHVTENVQSKLMDLVKSTFTDLKLDAKDHHPFEGELDQWIDSFTQEYYEFRKFCRFSGSSNDYNNANSISKLQKCYDTNWSSLSPDPKSDIRNLCRSDIDKF